VVFLEKVQLNFRKHSFEIQVSDRGIKFFEVKSPTEYVQLGSAEYMISRDGALMHITSGTFTIDPKRFGLSRADVGRVERALVGEAERAIFRKNPGINHVVGTLFDTVRKQSIDAEVLFRKDRAQKLTPKRIRFGLGRPKPPRKRRK
jgi:hypothetical protein